MTCVCNCNETDVPLPEVVFFLNQASTQSLGSTHTASERASSSQQTPSKERGRKREGGRDSDSKSNNRQTKTEKKEKKKATKKEKEKKRQSDSGSERNERNNKQRKRKRKRQRRRQRENETEINREIDLGESLFGAQLQELLFEESVERIQQVSCRVAQVHGTQWLLELDAVRAVRLHVGCVSG